MPASRLQKVALQTLIAFALTVVATSALAQKSTRELPANAHTRAFGDSWTCDRGYRETDGKCVAVVVPANAYGADNAFGDDWRCAP